MKVEFLAEGSADCPLLRLFDYRPGEVERLCEFCKELAANKRVEFALHDQPWVETIGGCGFVWQLSENDIGVALPASDEPFVWELSAEAWHEVHDKLLQFTDGSVGFNWLNHEGDVAVLISLEGTW